MNDIEIARSIKMENITKVAEKFGIDEEYIDQYGKYKGKISNKLTKKTTYFNYTWPSLLCTNFFSSFCTSCF